METTGIFTFRKIDEIAARQMVSWQYDAPYDTYSCAPGELEASVQWVLKSQHQYYTVWDENQELIGFRCFGEDTQVNGGDYSSDALDMGGGLRPDWAGKGLGASLNGTQGDRCPNRYFQFWTRDV